MQFQIFQIWSFMILSVAAATSASSLSSHKVDSSKHNGSKPAPPKGRANFTNKSSHENVSASLLEVLHGPMVAADLQEQRALLQQQREAHSNAPLDFPQASGYGESVQQVAVNTASQPSNTRAAPQEDPNGPPQVLIADGNTIMPADMMMQPPMAHSDPAARMAMVPSTHQMAGAQAEQQVLASLYIDQFGNQQLGIPRLMDQQQPVAQQMAPDQSAGPHTASFRSFSSPGRNFYGPQSAQQIAMHRARSGSSAGQKEKLRLRDGMKFAEAEQPPAAGQQDPNKLTNKQLMSLIDELKEFNSKQASNLRAKDAPSSKEQASDEQDDEGKSSDADNDIDPTNVESMHIEATPRRQTSPIANDKISTDDLAKFAKFLMTKEGSNMRFQLGLEKDAPDDGDLDEDDRDPLLESKRKTSKLRAKPTGKISSSKELNELDQRHSEVSEQMDKLLEDLTGTLNEGPATKKSKKKKEPRPSDNDADDELSRMRRSRTRRLSPSPIKTHVVAETINRADEEPARVVVPLREKGHEDNFARQLIEQELQQDQLESKLRAQHNQKSPPQSSRAGATKKLAPEASEGQARRKGRQVDRVQISGGNEQEPYTEADRDRDRVAMMRELGKSRANKSKLRSGSAAPHNPIVRQALEGGIGMQAESHPNGNLVLKSSRGHSMTLKLPKKGDKSTRVSHVSSNDHDVGNLTREQADASEQNDGSKLASERPLKDEYPISERVSNGLNALGNNLDRYFNDGFMSEIESKSMVAGGSKSPSEPNERQQASSSNIKELAASDKDKQAAAEGDQDFDVNVGIDGKHELVDKDEDYDYETDEEAAKKPESGGKSSEAAKTKSKRRKAAAAVNLEDKRKRPQKRVVPQKRSSKLAREPSPHAVQGLNSEPSKGDDRLDHGFAGRTIKQNLSAADEHLTFENHKGPLPGKVDPVEGESFDSPIGPDGDNLELQVPASADKKVESSHESKNVLTRHGKRVFAPKFYEEPEWR